MSSCKNNRNNPKKIILQKCGIENIAGEKIKINGKICIFLVFCLNLFMIYEKFSEQKVQHACQNFYKEMLLPIQFTKQLKI